MVISKKICSKCGQEKPLSEFFTKDKKSGRLHTECKDCYREHRKTYYREHYQKYHEQYLERAKNRRRKVKIELQTELLKYLSDHKCVVCKENDPIVLEFDHIDPTTKSFSIARAISDGMKWSEIMIEIQKCQILCANCHKRKTAHENNWYHLVK